MDNGRRCRTATIVEVVFKPDEDISERVIFPVTASQSNGIEDARFVEFDDGGRKIFYATYTAYSGRAIRSELIETADFLSFRMSPLQGAAARNKGMALFPRKIDGKYAMIGRQDNENLYLIYSDDLYSWDGGVAILKPQFPWEFVQIGNCGSPIELDEGWLLLTHGVGPVRKYSIGAVLLDKRRSLQGSRAVARAAGAARAVRARRLRPQRRLHMRRDAARRPDRPPLCGVRHLLQFRDHQDRGADEDLGRLTDHEESRLDETLSYSSRFRHAANKPYRCPGRYMPITLSYESESPAGAEVEGQLPRRTGLEDRRRSEIFFHRHRGAAL